MKNNLTEEIIKINKKVREYQYEIVLRSSIFTDYIVDYHKEKCEKSHIKSYVKGAFIEHYERDELLDNTNKNNVNAGIDNAKVRTKWIQREFINIINLINKNHIEEAAKCFSKLQLRRETEILIAKHLCSDKHLNALWDDIEKSRAKICQDSENIIGYVVREQCGDIRKDIKQELYIIFMNCIYMYNNIHMKEGMNFFSFTIKRLKNGLYTHYYEIKDTIYLNSTKRHKNKKKGVDIMNDHSIAKVTTYYENINQLDNIQDDIDIEKDIYEERLLLIYKEDLKLSSMDSEKYMNLLLDDNSLNVARKLIKSGWKKKKTKTIRKHMANVLKDQCEIGTMI